jgi:hypothetical protein
MNYTLKQRIISVIAASVVLAGAVGVAQVSASEQSSSSVAVAGDPSQWGLAKKGSFDITRKVNEYEGQH